MILCDRAAGPVTRTAHSFVLTLGLLALPFLPALASGQQARAPGTDAPARAGSVVAGARQSQSFARHNGRKSRPTRRCVQNGRARSDQAR